MQMTRHVSDRLKPRTADCCVFGKHATSSICVMRLNSEHRSGARSAFVAGARGTIGNASHQSLGRGQTARALTHCAVGVGLTATALLASEIPVYEPAVPRPGGAKS